jgi:hypothetical protein
VLYSQNLLKYDEKADAIKEEEEDLANEHRKVVEFEKKAITTEEELLSQINRINLTRSP